MNKRENPKLTTSKKKGLGKGLAAILSQNTSLNDKGEVENSSISGYIPDLDINLVAPNPYQPRISIDDQDLIGLADSIREHGIIEPLIVTTQKAIKESTARPGNLHRDYFKGVEGFDESKGSETEDFFAEYLIVAGERRWRAAKLAQMNTIPVMVKDLTPQEILEIAIIENIQRKDLNPLEEAFALSELYNNYRVTLENIARKLGKSPSGISNKLRLLKLPKVVQAGILQGKISESHAYQLLQLQSQDALIAAYNIVTKKQLSVLETEKLVKQITHAHREILPPKENKRSILYDNRTMEIEENLSTKLGKGVKLTRKNKGGGKITIPFQSDEQLDRLYEFIIGKL